MEARKVTLSSTPQQLLEIGIVEGEIIVDSIGTLKKEYKNGVCIVNVDICYTYINNTVQNQDIKIMKSQLSEL